MSLSKVKYFVKSKLENLPFSIGKFISYIPNQIIFGYKFENFKKDIVWFENLTYKNKEKEIFKRVKNITTYAYDNVFFYKEYYSQKGFLPSTLKSFDDIQRIPIINRELLQEYNLSLRSHNTSSGIKINTGGTSGEPLEFYVEENSFSREWAHMLHIWKKVDYSRKDLKLTFRGKNIGKHALKYNPVGNEYYVNAYLDMNLVVKSLEGLLSNRKISFLHGYPSAIYEFAKFIDKNNPYVKEKLNRNLKGILYGSEFPAPIYRKLIERVFPVPQLSWYGHSEMCILAYEKNKMWNYEPLHTYGYCEAIPYDDGDYRLIGTNYFNNITPLIRYDTGDLISPKFKNKMVNSFWISKGRVGEFIKDTSGNNISLTSLVFGRHHGIFGKVKFIQVSQEICGFATIYLIPNDNEYFSVNEIRDNFDDTAVDIIFSYKIISQPFRTSSGKTPLLIKANS